MCSTSAEPRSSVLSASEPFMMKPSTARAVGDVGDVTFFEAAEEEEASEDGGLALRPSIATWCNNTSPEPSRRCVGTVLERERVFSAEPT